MRLVGEAIGLAHAAHVGRLEVVELGGQHRESRAGGAGARAPGTASITGLPARSRGFRRLRQRRAGRDIGSLGLGASRDMLPDRPIPDLPPVRRQDGKNMRRRTSAVRDTMTHSRGVPRRVGRRGERPDRRSGRHLAQHLGPTWPAAISRSAVTPGLFLVSTFGAWPWLGACGRGRWPPAPAGAARGSSADGLRR